MTWLPPVKPRTFTKNLDVAARTLQHAKCDTRHLPHPRLNPICKAMLRLSAALATLVFITACDVTPQSVEVCESVSILPTLHNAESYDRLHYRIVPAAGNTVDVKITFTALDEQDRTFKRTESCNLPKNAALNEQEAREHLERKMREDAAIEEKTERDPKEVERRYHERMEARTNRLLKAKDEEGKAILKELQELMTIDKEGYKSGAAASGSEPESEPEEEPAE